MVAMTIKPSSSRNKIKINIVTPAPVGSLHGNRITAQRWDRFLKKLGYSSRITESWAQGDTDLLIALHAYRSHDSILRFKQKYPHKPVILMMTGTDLYRDIKQHPEVLISMQLADKIVLLQSAAMEIIPKALQKKVHVIYQSVKAISRKPLLKRCFLVSVIGHLRPEKDPFCTARCLAELPSESVIRVQHLGKAMSPDMRQMAIRYQAKLPRYEWLDEVSHAQALQRLARSHLMVITSLMEGGAHVVSEAIAIGVPVVASDIPGNRGLLGESYSAYFPVGDEKALAALLHRAETEPRFYRSLEKQIHARQSLIKPAFEMRSIQSLVNSVLLSTGITHQKV
ncbi:putative glycosyltransferase (TIGR04348 family) [Polynucleobacter brandtiae]|uniref:Putative glycosyltransferase (TIGR04348 family) n=2 Tax=Polynucleobacter brandtiae TaxID=1938816 RepID=A0A2M8VZQ5_9BURK|nr:putative glycosyltransferase (TIGR04348 family) [Polynucleobacter brandtiae]